MTGGGFVLVTATGASPEQRAEVARRGAVLVPAHPGSPLQRWLRRGHATSAVVRPDGTVLRAGRDVAALCAALPAFAADPGHVTVTSRVGPASTRADPT